MTSINVNDIFEAAKTKQGFRFGERKSSTMDELSEDITEKRRLFRKLSQDEPYGWTVFGGKKPAIPMKNAPPSLPFRYGFTGNEKAQNVRDMLDNVRDLLSTVELRAGIKSGDWNSQLGTMAQKVRTIVPFAELIIAPEIVTTTAGKARTVKTGSVADFVGMTPTVSVPVRRTAILVTTHSPADQWQDTLYRACWQALEMEMRRHPGDWGSWITELTKSLEQNADAELTFGKSSFEIRSGCFAMFAKSEMAFGRKPVYEEEEFDTGELDEEGNALMSGTPFFQKAFGEVLDGVIGRQLAEGRNGHDIYLTEDDKQRAA